MVHSYLGYGGSLFLKLAVLSYLMAELPNGQEPGL